MVDAGVVKSVQTPPIIAQGFFRFYVAVGALLLRMGRDQSMQVGDLFLSATCSTGVTAKTTSAPYCCVHPEYLQVGSRCQDFFIATWTLCSHIHVQPWRINARVL